MGGIGNQSVRRRFLDDPPLVQNDDAVREESCYAQVVGHEEHRHARPALEFGQEPQEPRLGGRVEARRRFVQEQDVWLVHERASDLQPLLHAA